MTAIRAVIGYRKNEKAITSRSLLVYLYWCIYIGLLMLSKPPQLLLKKLFFSL